MRRAVVDRARSWAYGSPRVAVLAAPSDLALGWQVERACVSRGWDLAVSPAGTELLVVVGDLEGRPDPLRAAADVWWHHVGAPRARTTVRRASEADGALDAALERLRDWPVQGQESLRGNEVAELLGAGDEERGRHDMEGHGGHDMADVAGLPMAGTGDDRDGLALDLITYRFGPFLHGWPAGLVVRTQLSGDIVATADVEAKPHLPEPVPGRPALAHAVAEVLDLAGWGSASREVRSARNQLLDGGDLGASHRRWITRVRRSRTLRWTLRGIAVLQGHDAADRMADSCDELLSPGPARAADVVLDVDPDDVVAVMAGTELARARIAVASLALHASSTTTGSHAALRGGPR